MSDLQIILLMLVLWNAALTLAVLRLYRLHWRSRVRQSLGLAPFVGVDSFRIGDKVRWRELDR